MYDCCVARERLRIIMSSIMRWRRGLVVPIGGPPVMRGGGCDDHILSDGRLHLSPFPPAPKEQVRSIRSGDVGNAFALSKRSGISTALAAASISSMPARHTAIGIWLFIAWCGRRKL